MRKKKIALAATAVLVAVAALATFVATRPSIHRVERSVLVEAPPGVVLAQISDPKRWVVWSPWEGRDPRVSRKYGGPPEGEGATCYWSGDARVGQGRLTVMRVSAEQVDLEREIEKPAASLSDFEFRVAPEGAGTRLRWRTTSESAGDLWSRARALLARHDEPAGTDMERGLARLKAVAEAQASAATWRVQRSVSVAAPPAAVLAQIVDLHHWMAWSPWEHPSMRRSYGGPAEGAGASYYWSGDDEVGRGRLTILEVSPAKVVVEMELIEPRASGGDIEFRLAPEGAGTRVTWAMTGEVEVMGEVLGRAGSPETTVGVDFEKGLARLEAVLGGGAQAQVAR